MVVERLVWLVIPLVLLGLVTTTVVMRPVANAKRLLRASSQSRTARTPHVLVSYALRGALTGLAVCGTMYFALQYAESVVDPHPEGDGLAILGATFLIMLKVGIPISFVLGLLVAWASRLRRPWAVSLLGLLNTGVLSYGGSTAARTGGTPCCPATSMVLNSVIASTSPSPTTTA